MKLTQIVITGLINLPSPSQKKKNGKIKHLLSRAFLHVIYIKTLRRNDIFK